MTQGRYIVADATNAYDFGAGGAWEIVVAGLAPLGLAPPLIDA